LFLPEIDVFDEVSAFVLEEPGSARLLYGAAEEPMCLRLETGELDERLVELRNTLEGLGRRAGAAGW